MNKNYLIITQLVGTLWLLFIGYLFNTRCVTGHLQLIAGF